MPLNLAALQSGIQSVAASPPPDVAGCAQAWADAVGSYAAGIVPASTAVSAAASTLASALAGAFSSGAAAPGMEAGFAAFAASLGAGMVGYTPTPPPGPVGFALLFAGPRSSHAEAAAAVASAVDTWMRTGSAVLIAPPNTLVPWS